MFTVPLDLPIVTREHFNRWYSIKAYYFAVTFADLPLQFVCVLIYVLITYLMTSQPLEIFRIALFLLVFVLVTLVSQGWGMLVGAVCGVNVIFPMIFYLLILFYNFLFFFRSVSVGRGVWTICNCTVFSIFRFLFTFL